MMFVFPIIRDIDYESEDIQKHLYVKVSGSETYEVRDSTPVAPVTDFQIYYVDPYWDVDGILHRNLVLSLSTNPQKYTIKEEHKLEVYYQTKDFKHLIYSGWVAPQSSEISSSEYTSDTDTIIYEPKK